MRSAPAVQVRPDATGWCRVWAGLALCTLLSCTVWWATRPMTDRAGAAGLAVALSLASGWAAASTWRGLQRVEALAWDGAAWTLHLEAQPTPVSGHIHAVMDFGGWMLLRFHPEASSPRRLLGCMSLPVSRRRAAGHWHGLRCAVYCARPASAPMASGQAADPT